MLTNDPRNGESSLKIFGTVERFATISPQHVWLGGSADKPIKSNVTIVPEKKYPFKIVKSQAKIGAFIKFELKEISQSGNLRYVLVVENTKKEKGNYHDQIFLYTDSKIKSRITINVNGRIDEAVSGKDTGNKKQ